MNELSLMLPGERWRDTTTHTLETTAPDGLRVTLDVIRLDPLPLEQLRGRVDADVRGRARELRGFELLSRQDFESGEVRGTAVSFRVVTQDGALHHEMAYVPTRAALLVFIVRASARHAALCRDILVSAIEAIQLRE